MIFNKQCCLNKTVINIICYLMIINLINNLLFYKRMNYAVKNDSLIRVLKYNICEKRSVYLSIFSYNLLPEYINDLFKSNIT